MMCALTTSRLFLNKALWAMWLVLAENNVTLPVELANPVEQEKQSHFFFIPTELWCVLIYLHSGEFCNSPEENRFRHVFSGRLKRHHILPILHIHASTDTAAQPLEIIPCAITNPFRWIRDDSGSARLQKRRSSPFVAFERFPFQILFEKSFHLYELSGLVWTNNEKKVLRKKVEKCVHTLL